ncbi:MAG: transcription antitermination factor NusB [Armatimonadaceae bacterium]|jgi:N utilization substance protein B
MPRTHPSSSRRAARECALRILYTLEVGRSLRDDVVRETVDAAGLEPEAAQFAQALALAVDQNRDPIDAIIARHAHGYPPERQTVVDRTLLRMAIAENESPFSDASPAVIVTEAVEMAKKYSTPEASRFIHGVLGGALNAPPEPDNRRRPHHA